MSKKTKSFGQKEILEELRAATTPYQPVKPVYVLENRKNHRERVNLKMCKLFSIMVIPHMMPF